MHHFGWNWHGLAMSRDRVREDRRPGMCQADGRLELVALASHRPLLGQNLRVELASFCDSGARPFSPLRASVGPSLYLGRFLRGGTCSDCSGCDPSLEVFKEPRHIAVGLRANTFTLA